MLNPEDFIGLDETTGELTPRPVSKPFVRTRFNYDRNLAGNESGLACSDPTRAQQQFAEECDINTIVRRFGVTGELPQSRQIPMNGDFTEVVDYQTALHKLMEADAAFMELPSDVRKRFDNDPGKLVDFVSDPANKEEVRKLGLGRPETPLPGPIEVRVIPDPSEPPKTP